VTRVSLIISPRLGNINEAQVVEKGPAIFWGLTAAVSRMMANYWREGETLRVERREPTRPDPAKIPVL